jgi:hypothetical protein
MHETAYTKKWQAIENRIDTMAHLVEDDLKDMGLPDALAHGIALDCADAAMDVADGKVITDAGLDVQESMHKYKTVEIDDNTGEKLDGSNVPWDDDEDLDTRYIGDDDYKSEAVTDVAWNDEADYAVDPATDNDADTDELEALESELDEIADEEAEIEEEIKEMGLSDNALAAILGPSNTELDEIEAEQQEEARKHPDVVDIDYEEIIIPDNDNEDIDVRGVA